MSGCLRPARARAAEAHAEEWDLDAVDPEQRQRAREDAERETEEQPAVALHLDAEPRQVADDRAGDDGQRQEGAERDRARPEQQRATGELGETRADAAPGLEPE